MRKKKNSRKERWCWCLLISLRVVAFKASRTIINLSDTKVGVCIAKHTQIQKNTQTQSSKKNFKKTHKYKFKSSHTIVNLSDTKWAHVLQNTHKYKTQTNTKKYTNKITQKIIKKTQIQIQILKYHRQSVWYSSGLMYCKTHTNAKNTQTQYLTKINLKNQKHVWY